MGCSVFSAFLHSMKAVLDQLHHFLGDAFIHLFRQAEAVIQHILTTKELEQHLLHLSKISKGPGGDSRLSAYILPLAEEAQDMQHRITDFLTEMQPVGPLRR